MKNLILTIAVLAGAAFSIDVRCDELAAALDTQDLPTFYIETAARSANHDATLDTLAFYTPMVARAESNAELQIAESFFVSMVPSHPALTVDPSLDLLVFYTPMVITRDLQTSIDTLAFYTQMVAPPVEFDIQTSFDVPVPYERRAARSAPEAT